MSIKDIFDVAIENPKKVKFVDENEIDSFGDVIKIERKK